jgi:uncharacterized membrane protein YgaE (UPF0421/DUF939 family)
VEISLWQHIPNKQLIYVGILLSICGNFTMATHTKQTNKQTKKTKQKTTKNGNEIFNK